MSGGVLGFCLCGVSCAPEEEEAAALTAPGPSLGSGKVVNIVVSPIQARLAALGGSGSVQSKVQGALSASPIGARLQMLTGSGMATDASHYHDFAPTGVPYRDIVGGPNRGFLGHF